MQNQRNLSLVSCLAICMLVVVVSCRLTQEQQVALVAATPWVLDFVYFPKSTTTLIKIPTYQPSLTAPFTRTKSPSSTLTQASTFTTTATSSSTPSETSTPTSTMTPTATATLTLTPLPTPVFSRGDLHMHTRCSDGADGYEEMVNKALLLDYDFIAITDHRFGGEGSCGHVNGTCDDNLCDRIITKCRNETRLFCIPGMEVTSTSQHLLAIGIQTGIDKSQPMQAQVEEIHRQGGLAILAHPGLLGTHAVQPADIARIDGIECRSSFFSELIPPYLEIAQMLGIPCVYNSDAHSTEKMGIHTVCMGQVRNLQDLKTALIEGKCAAGIFQD